MKKIIGSKLDDSHSLSICEKAGLHPVNSLSTLIEHAGLFLSSMHVSCTIHSCSLSASVACKNNAHQPRTAQCWFTIWKSTEKSTEFAMEINVEIKAKMTVIRCFLNRRNLSSSIHLLIIPLISVAINSLQWNSTSQGNQWNNCHRNLHRNDRKNNRNSGFLKFAESSSCSLILPSILHCGKISATASSR